MITEAITKITTEVNSIKGDHAQNIGEYLIDTINEESASKIMVEGKTLSGCISSVTAKAKAKAVNNCAMIADTDVYAWVREYYGIGAETSARPEAVLQPAAQPYIDLMDLI